MRVLLHHQHREAMAPQVGDGLEDLVLVARRETERGLVQEQQLGRRFQHHRRLQDLLFAAAQIPCQHVQLGGQHGEESQHAVHRGLDRRAAQRVGAEVEVLAHRHYREVAASLRHKTNAQRQPLARRQLFDLPAFEQQLAPEVLVNAIHGLEQRGFARTVGTDDGGDASRGNGRGEVGDDGLVAVADRERLEFEQGCRCAHVNVLALPAPSRRPGPGKRPARAGRCGSGWAGRRRSCGRTPAPPRACTGS